MFEQTTAPTASSRPEEAVPGIQLRPRSFTFEYGDLLPEGEDFEGRVAPTPEEEADHGEDGGKTNEALSMRRAKNGLLF
jgi:hypothetical protein